MSETWSLGASVGWCREVLRRWGQWTRGHLLATLGLSVAAFVVGWVWNTYLMAVDLEGSVVALGQETTATADGHTGNGLFWLLLFSLVGGLITYAWSRGVRNFLGDLAVLPRRFGEAVATGSGAALAMLLWGASVSLILSTLISSAVSLALGLVLLALAATPVGVILNFVLVRLWRGLAGVLAPDARARLAVTVSPFMVMLGEALGLFFDWIVGGWLIGLLVGVGCAVVSLLLARTGRPPRTAVLLGLVGAAVAWQVLRVRWAYADDGGWSECVTGDGLPCADAGLGGIFAWLTSPGAGHLMARGAIGGLFATIGAAIGVGVGGAAAGVALAAAQTSASRATASSPVQTTASPDSATQTTASPESAPQGSAPQGSAPQQRAGEAGPAATGSEQITQPVGFTQQAAFGQGLPETGAGPDLVDQVPGQVPGQMPDQATGQGAGQSGGAEQSGPRGRSGGIDDVLPEAARRERDEESDRP